MICFSCAFIFEICLLKGVFFCIFTTFKNDSDSYTLFFWGVYPTASSLSSVSSSPKNSVLVSFSMNFTLQNPVVTITGKGDDPIYIYTLLYIHIYMYKTKKALNNSTLFYLKKICDFYLPKKNVDLHSFWNKPSTERRTQTPLIT